MLGLKEIRRIRQYTDFDVDGKIMRMYEMTFTTEKTEGEFTLDVKADVYTPEVARKLVAAKAEEIDKAIG
ncbi:hypothetical protein ES705_48279 [subsurface metagenome]